MALGNLECGKNTKTLSKTKQAKNQQLGKGQFEYLFDVRSGKQKESEDLRLAWRKEKEDKRDDDYAFWQNMMMTEITLVSG